MPSAPREVGETVPLVAVITDPVTGGPVTPATIVFEVLAPGATTTQTLTSSQGPTSNRHTAEVVPNIGGEWWWRVTTTNPNGRAVRSFPVNANRFPS